MRYLGIDYGERRIGLAVSDAEGRIAFPRDTVSNLQDVIDFIKRELVETVVLGLPCALDGHDTTETLAVKRFAAKLKSKVELPMVLENEMYTSKIAEATSSKEHADAAAAALILQSYLDKQVK